ncbi:MAG TPA: macro domain-containing protein [Polyangiaceae bacterium]|jgi:O-acetyl-ADP-ribose deacetylase (regulator of RNase III)|nr:macro domain-containing protein [Polyangiaceae bacterium]
MAGNPEAALSLSEGASKIELVWGDIVDLDVAAVVSSSDPSLLSRTGVAGRIHVAAGPELYQQCRQLPELSSGVRCRTGSAVLTKGYRLRAHAVIHTVGPVWVPGEDDAEASLVLADCYRSVLRLGDLLGMRSVAFPAIACGARGFPIARGAAIAVSTVRQELANLMQPMSVTFVAFNREVSSAFSTVLRQGSGEHPRSA